MYVYVATKIERIRRQPLYVRQCTRDCVRKPVKLATEVAIMPPAGTVAVPNVRLRFRSVQRTATALHAREIAFCLQSSWLRVILAPCAPTVQATGNMCCWSCRGLGGGQRETPRGLGALQ